jgi:hypothetical protein
MQIFDLRHGFTILTQLRKSLNIHQFLNEMIQRFTRWHQKKHFVHLKNTKSHEKAPEKQLIDGIVGRYCRFSAFEDQSIGTFFSNRYCKLWICFFEQYFTIITIRFWNDSVIIQFERLFEFVNLWNWNICQINSFRRDWSIWTFTSRFCFSFCFRSNVLWFMIWNVLNDSFSLISRRELTFTDIIALSNDALCNKTSLYYQRSATLLRDLVLICELCWQICQWFVNFIDISVNDLWTLLADLPMICELYWKICRWFVNFADGLTMDLWISLADLSWICGLCRHDGVSATEIATSLTFRVYRPWDEINSSRIVVRWASRILKNNEILAFEINRLIFCIVCAIPGTMTVRGNGRELFVIFLEFDYFNIKDYGFEWCGSESFASFWQNDFPTMASKGSSFKSRRQFRFFFMRFERRITMKHTNPEKLEKSGCGCNNDGERRGNQIVWATDDSDSPSVEWMILDHFIVAAHSALHRQE